MENNEQNSQEQIGDQIRYYQDLLAQKGYTEESLGDGQKTGTIAETIDKAFREFDSIPQHGKKDIGVEIGTVGILGKQKEGVTFDFIFSYNTQQQSLKLLSLKAETYDLKLTCFPEASGNLPNLDAMLLTIEDARKTRDETMQQQQKPKGPRL